MALLSFLCIDATKAGTTWLNAQLECHPGVCMPVVKELHDFSAVNTPGHSDGPPQPVTRAFKREFRYARRAKSEGTDGPATTALARHLRGLLAMPFFSDDWYRACFRRPDKPGALCGEITPAYAELPDAAFDHVNRLLPGVRRIIHLLRHPLDWALSHLRMAAHPREVDATENALMRLLEGNPDIHSLSDDQTRGPRWRRHMPPDPPNRSTPPAASTSATGVIQYLEARVQPTIDFLNAEFGKDFLRATR